MLARAARARGVEAARHDIHVEELEERMAEIARIQADTAGRVHTMGEVLSGRQAELARAVSERLDAVTHRIGQSMQASRRTRWRTCQAQRAPRGDRRRAEEHHRPGLAGDVAARGARQQAGARRVRPGPHGGDRPGRAAEGLVRIPVHALQREAAGLRGVSARRRAAADHRRQVSARGDQRAARRAHRRAGSRPRSACART